MLAVLAVNGPAPAHAQEGGAKPLVYYVHATNSVDDALWYQALVDHSEAAAKGLDIDLEIGFLGTVRPVVLSSLEERFMQAPKPDYVVFANQRGLGVDMLRMADAHGVKAFLYVAPLLEEAHAELGGPRGELPFWIGELIPDDEQAGYDLANLLIEDARTRQTEAGATGPLRLVGITGRRSTTSSTQRERGLMRALQEHDDVEFLQSVSARWQADTAGKKYSLLKKRYGQIDIVWAANDPMAIGVVEAARAEGDMPSIGGVDWTTTGVEAVRSGDFVASMGGHNFDIAFVLSLLRSHYDGEDFAETHGTPSLHSTLTPLTTEILPYYDRFEALKASGNVNFRKGFEGLATTPDALMDISVAAFVTKHAQQNSEDSG